MKGLRHLSGLYLCNAQIQQLAAEIATQERHKKHLRSLYQELIDLGRRKAELQQKWDTEYAPAEILRYELEVESTFAKTHPSDYFDYLLDQLVHLPVETIDRMIASASESSKHIKPISVARVSDKPTAQSQSYSSSTWSKLSIGESIASSLTAATTVLSEDQEPNLHRSIWPSIAKSRVEELRVLHAQNDMDMRSVASQTCALTVQAMVLKRELSVLEAKMKDDSVALYKDLKIETDEHRLRIMKQVHNFIQGRQRSKALV